MNGVLVNQGHIGSSSQKSQAWLDATSQSQGMSLVGSEFGSVNVTAGKDNNISGTILGTTSAGEIAAAKVANGTANAQKTQEAKDWLERLKDANAKDPLLAIHPHNIPPRDINLSGQSVSVTSGLDTLDQRTKFEAQQSGVTVALSNSVVSAVQGAASTGETLVNAASNTSSSRMQGLAGAAGALAAYNTYNQAKDILKDPGKANDISVNVSVGSSKSSASSQDKSTTAVGSQVVSAGSVNVTAKNPKSNPDGTTNTNDKTANAGHILIEGSQVIATEDINLNADRDINLLAAGNTSEHSSQNKSSSGSIGVGFNIGGPSTGLSVNASASRAKGQADGESQSSTNTRVQAGGTLTFNSGGDTTLQGATASAKQVTGTVGGNLNLSSLQDTSQYKENSQSSGFSVSVPITGGAASASVSHSKTKIDSDYQSVGEQTAIRAGDGGFDIDVKGKTTLTGAQITSTDKAVQDGKNSFKSAGGLDMQDLQNSAQYDASSYAVTLAKGSEPNKAPVLSGAGIGADSGQASSTSTSGISGIAGDTSARTGEEETGLKPLFDAAKVKQEVQAQVAITSEFGKQAGKAIKDYSEEQRKSLREQAKNASTPEEKAQTEQALKDVNMQERALNILVGALTGFGGTMLSKEAFSMAGEKMRDLMIEDSQKFAGVVDSTGKPLFSNISGDSSGVNGDGHKIGGTRADLDLLCGAGGARCDISKNPDGSIDSSKPVKFLGDEVLNPDGTTSRKSYEDFLKTADGQKMLSAPFGGLQGGDRTLFGQPYEKGSWVDQLIEAFAGPHDLMGGKLSGLYDSQGNIKQGMSNSETKAYDKWSGVALVPATPFAAAQFLSPETWKIISILLKAGL